MLVDKMAYYQRFSGFPAFPAFSFLGRGVIAVAQASLVNSSDIVTRIVAMA